MRASPSPLTHFLETTSFDAENSSDDELSPDSLFDEPEKSPSLITPPPKQPPAGTRTTAGTAAAASPEPEHDMDNLTCGSGSGSTISRRSAPPIPGLFLDPTLLLPADLADSVLRSCMTSFFADPGRTGGGGAGINQVMFFGRAGRDANNSGGAAFPPFLNALLSATSVLLLEHPTLPRETHAMLFPESTSASHVPMPMPPPPPPRARQAIVNLYRPGEGIAPHVDLLNRFGDGIVGVSLGGGATMRFARAETETETGKGRGVGTAVDADAEGDRDGGLYEVWLPPRSVLVLTGEARYEWTHGIAPRMRDKVEIEDAAGGDNRWQWQERGVRISVTFRWLLPGAEIVGGDSDSDDDGEDHHRTEADKAEGNR